MVFGAYSVSSRFLRELSFSCRSPNLITNMSTDKGVSERVSGSFANRSYHTTTTRSLTMALTIRGRFITRPPKLV